MPTTPNTEPISAPWVWTARDLTNSDDWIIILDDDAIADIENALNKVKKQGRATETITAQDFPLPILSTKLSHAKNLLTTGRGLCLIRGLPIECYTRAELECILWGLGTHIGTAVSQSYRGDMIGEVMDMTHTGDARRAYRSPRPLDLHIDLVDVVGLLCVRKAHHGGDSLVASSMAIHNAILAERPDLIPALYEGYHYRHSEASSTGEPPTSPHRIPVFGWDGSRIVCNFNSSPISRSLREDNIDNNPAALEAFDVFIRTAARPDFLHTMILEPGDIQLLNNRVALHGRTEFQDYPELDRKRLMLRVWLMMSEMPTLPENMRARKNAGGIPKAEVLTG